MGTSNTKMENQVTSLKAQIVTMERRQASVVKEAVKKTEAHLTIECERAVEEERVRADEIEEQRTVAELQNELLTEMVAAEQVNVKLQERRNEALKWELLRQGGSQEVFETIAKEVPVLEETLRANTTEVLQEVAKHDMAEAIEYVVGGIEEVKNDLQEAFLARDSGRTGALGGPAFKDALRESFPDMPREDRQLLMLRFVREVDQSVDYGEFLEFCSGKSQSRERLKMGLTGALAATRSGLRRESRAGSGGFSFSMPAHRIPGQRSKSLFATSPLEGGVGGRRGTTRADSIFSQGPVDPAFLARAEDILTRIVSRHGAELESLLLNHDPGRSGTIPVKSFSQCLRAFDAEGSVDGRLSGGREEAIVVAAGTGAGEKLTRADRKVLYRKWAVGGRVRYGDFLLASGYRPVPVPARRVSDGSGARPRKKHGKQEPPPPPPLVSRQKKGGSSEDDDGDGDDDDDGDDEEDEDDSRRQESKRSSTVREEEEEQGSEAEGLLERAKVVLIHLSEVLREEGEEAYFAAFEAQDSGNYRTLGEDGFVDAIVDLAPEITDEQALDVFHVTSKEEDDDGVNYDELFQHLREMYLRKAFRAGDDVQLRMETRTGKAEWVPAQVVSKDDDGTFTVAFRSSEVPGARLLKASGVPEADLRMTAPTKRPPPSKRAQKPGFASTVASWYAGLFRQKTGKGGGGASGGASGWSLRLSRLLGNTAGGGGGAEASRGTRKRKQLRSSPGKKKKKQGGVSSSGGRGKSGSKSGPGRRGSKRKPLRRSRNNDNDNDKESDESACATEPERTPRRHSPSPSTATASAAPHPNRSQHYGGGSFREATPESPSPSSLSNTSSGNGFWSSVGGGSSGVGGRDDPGSEGSITPRTPPGAGKGGSRRASSRARRSTDLDVIQEVVSTPPSRDRERRRHSDHPRRKSSPSASHTKRKPSTSTPEVKRRSSSRNASHGGAEKRELTLTGGKGGGLRSLETLEQGNIEEKFDLYKQRTKKALSPERRRSSGGGGLRQLS